MLAFHGTGGSGAQMRGLSHLDEAAEAESFLVVYPDGIDGEWNDGRPDINEGVDDVGFVATLLDELAAEFPIDATRVYATGLSNGGHLCYRLAFDLSDRISAIAPVGALLSIALHERESAPPRAMPVLIIAGDADPISPYGGGVVGGAVLRRGEVVSAEETLKFWTSAGGAVTEATRVEYTPNLDSGDGTLTRVETHAAAAGGSADVVLMTVEGGGHTWPGGEQYLPEAIVGRTSRDFSATGTILEFFKRWRREE